MNLMKPTQKVRASGGLKTILGMRAISAMKHMTRLRARQALKTISRVRAIWQLKSNGDVRVIGIMKTMGIMRAMREVKTTLEVRAKKYLKTDENVRAIPQLKPVFKVRADQRMLIRLKNGFLQLPDFIHDFGIPAPHHPRTSLALHLAVELALYRARVFLECGIGDAVPGYKLWNGFLSILFGLNCSFPFKDVALYSAWTMGILRLKKR